MQLTHPNFTTIRPARGAITNCPRDCPAFTRPKAIPAILGPSKRFTEAKTTGNPATPKPIEEIIPSYMERVNGFDEKGMSKLPIIVSKTPSVSVSPNPYLSASIPENGAFVPVTSCPKEKAKLICK